jgi:cysteinyl-tRNA synthetase
MKTDADPVLPYTRPTRMGLRLHNTLTRSVTDFSPLVPPRVGMYCCGPTVYDFGHIGNFRTFVFSDLVRRHLTFRGFEVNHVMNITDVEDKILRRVRETGLSLAEFTGQYTQAFLEDLDSLHCLRPHHLPRATDHIDGMLRLIGRLMERGIAYRAPDGSVYFSIDRYRTTERWPGCACRYGQLVNLQVDDQRPTERVASDEYDKDNLADFALWKARVPEDGDVFWESPWGQGRPGWHIECSAMSMALLGDTFDLHLGGEDLAFPHHEDEIAQSEGAGGLNGGIWDSRRPFVQHWLHAAHLLVEGRKMSKSLGNFFTVRDLMARGFSGREIRMLLLSAHYRETFNFTLAGLEGARTAVARIDECVEKLRELAGNPAPSSPPVPSSSPLIPSFTQALDDDLNVSRAWAAVFEWVRETNRALAAAELDPARAATELAAWQQVDAVLALGSRPQNEAPESVVALAEARVAAKKAKDFSRADALRGEIRALGWIVEDTPRGPKLKRA